MSRHPYLKQAFDTASNRFDITKLLPHLNRRGSKDRKVWDIDQGQSKDVELSSDSLWAKKTLRVVSLKREKPQQTSSRKQIRSQLRHDFRPLKDLHASLLNEMPNPTAKSRLKHKLQAVGSTVIKSFRALGKLEELLYASSKDEKYDDWKWGGIDWPAIKTKSRQRKE